MQGSRKGKRSARGDQEATDSCVDGWAVEDSSKPSFDNAAIKSSLVTGLLRTAEKSVPSSVTTR